MLRLNLAQWTGVAVTAIVVAGTDMDMVFAVPLGMLAGALATFFSAIANSALDKVAVTRRPG
jgi:uncharacterized membrane protein YccC